MVDQQWPVEATRGLLFGRGHMSRITPDFFRRRRDAAMSDCGLRGIDVGLLSRENM